MVACSDDDNSTTAQSTDGGDAAADVVTDSSRDATSEARSEAAASEASTTDSGSGDATPDVVTSGDGGQNEAAVDSGTTDSAVTDSAVTDSAVTDSAVTDSAATAADATADHATADAAPLNDAATNDAQADVTGDAAIDAADGSTTGPQIACGESLSCSLSNGAGCCLSTPDGGSGFSVPSCATAENTCNTSTGQSTGHFITCAKQTDCSGGDICCYKDGNGVDVTTTCRAPSDCQSSTYVSTALICESNADCATLTGTTCQSGSFLPSNMKACL